MTPSTAKPVAPSPSASATLADGLARQLAPALVQLAHGPGGNTVTLRLDPVGLGHVQVRIDRDPAGTPTIQVSAEHPDTLRLLVADQPQLHRALDDAGVASDGRTLSFSLDTPGGSAPGGSGGNAPGSSADGGAAGQQGGHRGARPAFAAVVDEDVAFPIPPAWLRAGVDITA